MAPANAAPFTDAAATAQLPVEWLDQAARFGSRGVSMRSEDLLIPRIYLLQQNSPQCDRRGARHVEGCEPGDFYLRTALNPVRSGVTGIEAIPCEMRREWVEFLPGRQGYVTAHDQPPNDLESRVTVENSVEKILQVRRSNGNIIVETRTFFLLVEGQPYVFGFKSTGHTTAKEWVTHQHKLRHPRTGAILPAFAHKYLLTTVPASNGKGRWFGVKFTDLGPASLAEMEAGNKLYEAVCRGSVRGEADAEPAF
jgi:hypothetical protein